MELDYYQTAIRNGADIILEISGLSKETIQTILSMDGIQSITVTVKGMQHRTRDIHELIYILKAKFGFQLIVDFTASSFLRT